MDVGNIAAELEHSAILLFCIKRLSVLKTSFSSSFFSVRLRQVLLYEYLPLRILRVCTFNDKNVQGRSLNAEIIFLL